MVYQSSGFVLKACCSGKDVIAAAGPERDINEITKYRQFAAVDLDDGGFFEFLL